MASKVAVNDVCGVSVSVEMNDAYVSVSMDVSDCGRSRPRNGVVASECDGDDATSGNLAYSVADVGEASVGITMRAMGITSVDNTEIIKNFEIKVDVVGA
jgi:hypothetical protein